MGITFSHRHNSSLVTSPSSKCPRQAGAAQNPMHCSHAAEERMPLPRGTARREPGQAALKAGRTYIPNRDTSHWSEHLSQQNPRAGRREVLPKEEGMG